MDYLPEKTVIVRTPEGIRFGLPLAGPMARFLAWVVDGLIVIALTMVLNVVVFSFAVVSFDVANALGILSYFILSTGYGMAFEWFWRGKTPGKLALRLTVMDENGLPLTGRQVILRNLLRAVDSMPFAYALGGGVMFFNKRAKRLGDIAAGTIVVARTRPGEPDLSTILAGKYNSFRAYPHLAARMRQRISPAEAGVAQKALLKREILDPEARVELFRDLAEHFRTVADFPQEATDGLSDEAFVRNTVDILFDTGPVKVKGKRR